MKSASAVSCLSCSYCDAVDVERHTIACSAFGNSPSRSWDCRRCHLFYGRTRIAGELSNGERSGSLMHTATRDSARCTLRENTTASLNTALGAEALDLDKQWMQRSSLPETTS